MCTSCFLNFIIHHQNKVNWNWKKIQMRKSRYNILANTIPRQSGNLFKYNKKNIFETSNYFILRSIECNNIYTYIYIYIYIYIHIVRMHTSF